MRDVAGERTLIARVRSGSDDAVSQLAAEYGPRIRQLAFRYMRNWEDAEEVTQDVLLKVVRKIDAFRGDAALSSWIHRITFNSAMSRLRTHRFSRRVEVSESELAAELEIDRQPAREPADWSALADEEVFRGQMRRTLVRALAHMPAVYRTPVLLRDVRGLSTEEAAAVLRVKNQTLKSRLHRGRLILRERLSRFAGGLTLRAAHAS